MSAQEGRAPADAAASAEVPQGADAMSNASVSQAAGASSGANAASEAHTSQVFGVASTRAAGTPSAGTAAAGSEPMRHHVHHSYIWLGSVRTVLTLIAAVAVASISSIVGFITEGLGGSAEDLFMLMVIAGIAFGVLVLVVAAVVAYQVVSYKHLYFTLSDSEFNLHSGILNKKRVYVPYQRVQSVDQRATLLQRLFGVCTVAIDTAGGSSNKAITVPYLTKQQAEWLRAELFARKGYVLQAAADASPRMLAGVGGPTQGNVLDVGAEVWRDVGGLFAGMSLDTGRVTYEYGLTNKELLLTGLSNNTAFALIVIGVLGALSQVIDVMFDLFPHASESMAEDIASQAASSAAGDMIVLFALGFIAVLALIWLLSAVASCVNYGGFRARRRDNRIEVERGLLQHTFQGVDVDRVQSVVVKQTFIRRLMGYCEVSVSKIDAMTGSDDGSGQQKTAQQGVVIHPFVKMARVPEILSGIIPEYADVPHEARPVAPVALRRALLRRCIWQGSGFWLAVAVAIVQLLVNVFAGEAGMADFFETSLQGGSFALYIFNMGAVALYAIAAVLLILDAVSAVLWFRESSFAFNERFMQLSTGGFSRETVSFPRQKIQFGYTRTNPFQRLARTATLSVRTAAGVGGTTVRLIDVREEDAFEWLAWVKPYGNVVE